MAQATLTKKLRIQPGQRALFLNAPQGYIQSLSDMPEEVEVSENAEGKFEFVQVFVKDSSELERFVPKAMDTIEYDGLFWLCYPKKSSKVATDLSRDMVWKLMDGTGLRPVTQVSVDQVWSALRFRPVEQVGK